MHIENTHTYRPIKVRETQILATDTRQQYREKIARITLDSMVQFVGLLDAKGTVLEINHVALDAVGISLSDVEGKPFWSTFWWQVSEEINKNLREYIERAALGEFVRWDVEIYGRAGGTETIIIDASLCPVKDEHGEVVFIAAEGRDISAKKAYELEIAQKNIELQGLLEHIRELDKIKTQFFAINRDLMSQTKLLSELFEQTPSFMAVLRGPKHIFEFSNTSFYKLVGNRPLINRPATMAFPEIAGQGFFELLDHVLASGETFKGTGLPVFLNRDPSIQLEQRYVDFVFQPLHGPDGLVTGIFVEGHDVTDEVIMKKQLIENEEKLNIVINASELGTWELNLKTQEVKYSDRYINILGYEKGVELKHEQILKHLHPDDIPIRLKAYEEAFSTGMLHYESRVIWNDDSIHWIEGRGKLFYDAENNPDRLIGTVRDITNEKNYEEELLKNEKKLDDLVKERTFQLARSNEDLQRFAHVASHDLKEPIRKIKTFSTLIQDEYHHLLPEKGNVFLTKILNATDRIYSMIDGVLSYSTLTAEDQPTSVVDLNEVLKNIESDLEILIQEKKATLVIAELPRIEGVPVLLYQLFYNLVNNSIKFSKSNEPPVINIQYAIDYVNDKPFAKIVLKDNGIGFAPEQSEKIFATFTRLNPKDKYEGTGLGLALCKKIIQRHEGYISAHGEINNGAEFTILLPFN
jgi:PAS domain S-box-containing protein